MRISIPPLLIAVAVAGCASTGRPVNQCPLFDYGGNPGDLEGLVSLAPELEQSLRTQLPADKHDGQLCWYASGEEILAAERDGNALYGVVFERSASGWTLTDKELILWAPH